MNHHKYAELFPMLGESELQDMAKDIYEYGLRSPIVIDVDNLILDGRNRYAACVIAGVKPIFEPFVGTDEEKLAYVLTANVHRRHMDSSQRAMVAARLKPIYEEQAAKRQKATRAKPGHKVAKAVANLPPRCDEGKSRDKAGAAMNVSGKSVDRAAKVVSKAVPEIVAAVDRGEIAVSAAAIVADLPVERQREIIESGGMVAVKEAAKPIPSIVISLDRIHPVLATIPALMPGIQAFFTADVKKYGQRYPVMVDESGVLLDGRSRVVACNALGIPVKYEIVRGTDEEKEAIVYSLNLSRRPLTMSQMAMLSVVAGW